MKIIGLCGGSGSGKGFVGKMFGRLGIPTIDTDKVYHKLISAPSACTFALKSEFGEEIINKDGSVFRPALRSKVFSRGNESRLQALNQITHKFILEECELLISKYEKEGKSAVLIDAPLLFESGFDKRCDLIILVVADKETRIKRITERDGISRDAATTRIDSQLSDAYLRERADFVIENSNGADAVFERVLEISKRI